MAKKHRVKRQELMKHIKKTVKEREMHIESQQKKGMEKRTKKHVISK